MRKGLNREVCPPSLSLHGGLDTLAIKTNNLLSKCGVTKGGYFRLNSDPYAGAVFLKAPDSHLSLWDKDLRLPFEAERVLLIAKANANANGGPFSTKTPPGFVYPKYPYSLENYKNNHKGLDSIMFRRRMSCNHYRHILEPSDLKLRGIPDSSDPFFSLTKELDFLNLFNRPIDDRLETWGFLYKHIIIRNKVAWDWGLSFPYH